MSNKSDSTRRCKKFGKGRGTGKHHTRRDRIADNDMTSDAQTKRAANLSTAQSHVKTTAQVGGILDIEHNPTAPGTIRSTQLADRTLRRPGAAMPRVTLIGDNTTTVAETLQQTIPAAVIPDGDDMLAAEVTDTDRDEALVALARAIDDEVACQLALPIEELDLTVRTYNILKRVGVNFIGELVDKTEVELLDIRNFGQKSIDEVKGKLAALELPLSLKNDTPAEA